MSDQLDSFIVPLMDVPQASFPSDDSGVALLELRNKAKRWQGLFLVLVTPNTPGAFTLTGEFTGYWVIGRVSYDHQYKGWDVVIDGGEQGEFRAWVTKLRQLRSLLLELALTGEDTFADASFSNASEFTVSVTRSLLNEIASGELS